MRKALVILVWLAVPAIAGVEASAQPLTPKTTIETFLNHFYGGYSELSLPTLADGLRPLVEPEGLARLRQVLVQVDGNYEGHGDPQHIRLPYRSDEIVLQYQGSFYSFYVTWSVDSERKPRYLMGYWCRLLEHRPEFGEYLSEADTRDDHQFWDQLLLGKVPRIPAAMRVLVTTSRMVLSPPFAEVWRNGRITGSISRLDACDAYTVHLQHSNGAYDLTVVLDSSAKIFFLDVDPSPAPRVQALSPHDDKPTVPDKTDDYRSHDDTDKLVAAALTRVQDTIRITPGSMAPILSGSAKYYPATIALSAFTEIERRTTEALSRVDYEGIAATVAPKLDQIRRDLRVFEIPEVPIAPIQPISDKRVAVIEAGLFESALARVNEIVDSLLTNGFFLTVTVQSTPDGATATLQVAESKLSRRVIPTKGVINIARGIYHGEVKKEHFKSAKLEDLDMFHQTPKKIVCELAKEGSQDDSHCGLE